MKLLVPVYDLSLVPAVVNAATAGGHIVAIVNPNSGPGKNAAVSGWKTAIANLRKAGAQVLYYVDLVQWNGDQGIAAPAAGTEKNDATLKAEMDKYVTWYGPSVGWFFDDLRPYSAARATRLKSVVSYKGGLTVANPGSGVSNGYLATGVNVLITWETNGYTHSPAVQWEIATPNRVGVMALGEPAFNAPLNLATQRKVALFFASNFPDGPQAYNHLPSYFGQMAAAVH